MLLQCHQHIYQHITINAENGINSLKRPFTSSPTDDHFTLQTLEIAGHLQPAVIRASVCSCWVKEELFWKLKLFQPETSSSSSTNRALAIHIFMPYAVFSNIGKSSIEAMQETFSQEWALQSSSSFTQPCWTRRKVKLWTKYSCGQRILKKMNSHPSQLRSSPSNSSTPPPVPRSRSSFHGSRILDW